MRPTGSPEELERRRLRALALLNEGLLPSEVARRVGVDRRSVRRWKAAARRRGEAGVRARPAPGRPPKLAPKHKRKLEALLLKGAQAAGFHTDLWTCPRVADLVERRFGVHYHVDHVGRLLHELGWSPQKPARRAVERDEAAIRRWVQEKWPRVKKTPLAKGRRSSSSTKPDS
jgi:transposase